MGTEQANPKGSVDMYFGLESPTGCENYVHKDIKQLIIQYKGVNNG